MPDNGETIFQVSHNALLANMLLMPCRDLPMSHQQKPEHKRPELSTRCPV